MPAPHSTSSSLSSSLSANSVSTKKSRQWIPPINSVLLTTVATIMVFSLLMVASASIPFAQTKKLGDFYFFYHQLAYMGIGAVLGLLVYFIPLRKTFRLDFIMYALLACLLLIIYTLIGGSVINGSKRWIELGGINFQPSELAKLLMILYTSDYLVRR